MIFSHITYIHGGKKQPRTQKRVVGHSWGEIALGTAMSCAQMGGFGALMGLSVGEGIFIFSLNVSLYVSIMGLFSCL